jgi:hypothetical protein
LNHYSIHLYFTPFQLETQIKFYEVLAISADLYGSNNWVLTDKGKNRISSRDKDFWDQH